MIESEGQSGKDLSDYLIHSLYIIQEAKEDQECSVQVPPAFMGD